MPPNILQVHTEYELIKSVGLKVLWAESPVQRTGEYFFPLQSHAKIVEVEIGGVAIYRPLGEFCPANSNCHLVRDVTGLDFIDFQKIWGGNGVLHPPARRSLDKEQKGLRGDFSGSGNGGFQQFWFRDKEKPRSLGHQSLPPTNIGRVDEEMASPGGRKSDSPSLKGNVSPIDSVCLFFLKANDGAVVCWNCYPIDCVLGMLRKCSLRAVGNTDFA
ncbi:uncharacterized protein TNCV_4607591 [Trichonephila clavipes]|nr:uncharacterized protein TNCV_4607591 [Trichonephila clavipes]